MNSLGHLYRRTLIPAAVLAALTSAASVLWAYHQTLDESDIMAAYHLGTDANFNSFIANYEKLFPSATHTYISSIAIRTPFCNLVQLRHDQAGRTSAQNFRDEYLAHPDDSFTAILTVQTPGAKTSQGLNNPDSDFWKSFRFELSQDDPIPPRNLSASTLHTSIYNSYSKTYSDAISGAVLYLQFDVQDIPSKLTHLKATAPDGSVFTADFNLDRLK
ncbi:MAG TPA: hypothetical protein VEG63_02865 [Candidatus Acidoferrales bacterium]|nr:hypothetical protein [Candidatus Acidoferrales bacterium]